VKPNAFTIVILSGGDAFFASLKSKDPLPDKHFSGYSVLSLQLG